MTIQVDSREKARAITRILSDFDRAGVTHFVSKLYVGDYMSLDNPKVIIDRKQSLLELCGNVCQEHKRFAAELKRAQDAHIHMIILCEHGGKIRTLDDVLGWVNPRLKTSPLAVSGERLYRILTTMSATYGVEFLFCDKRQTGKRIMELLGGSGDALGR